MILGIIAGGMQPASAGDPYFANVISLMNSAAGNGLTSFVDAKGFTCTLSGTAETDTSMAGTFGGTCIAFPLATDAGITNNNVTLLDGGDFTIEVWVYLTSTPSGTYGAGLIGSDGNTSNGWQLRINSNNIQWVYPGLAAGARTGAITLNTLSHVMVSRAGTQHYIALDGALSTVTMTNRTSGGSAQIRLGRQSYGGTFTGYLIHRVTRGICRWTANFTPPPPPFPMS